MGMMALNDLYTNYAEFVFAVRGLRFIYIIAVFRDRNAVYAKYTFFFHDMQLIHLMDSSVGAFLTDEPTAKATNNGELMIYATKLMGFWVPVAIVHH